MPRFFDRFWHYARLQLRWGLYALVVFAAVFIACEFIDEHLKYNVLSRWMSLTIFSVVTVIVFIVTRRQYNHLRRNGFRCCERCGYPYTGNDTIICTECGETFNGLEARKRWLAQYLNVPIEHEREDM